MAKSQKKPLRKTRDMAITHESNSIKETAEIAEKLLVGLVNSKRNKKAALVVGLSGNLGAGKTALVKAIAKHLKIRDKISSPTFVIMKRYPVSLKVGNKPGFQNSPVYKSLYHLDAYRLKNEQELLSLGWNEIVKDPEHIIFIEWPENVKKAMPPSSKQISISHGEKGKRIFKLEPSGKRKSPRTTS